MDEETYENYCAETYYTVWYANPGPASQSYFTLLDEQVFESYDEAVAHQNKALRPEAWAVWSIQKVVPIA